MKQRNVLLCGALFMVLAVSILKAQFGFGGIVFDPSNTAQTAAVVAQEVENGASITQELANIIKLYNETVQAYQLASQMAKQFGNKSAWKTMFFQLGQETIQQHYGETVNLAAVMNGQYSQAATAWSQSVYQPPPANFMGNVSAQNSQRMSQYAAVQLMDQTSTRCAQVLSQFQTTQAANQFAALQLQADTVDAAGDSNTQVAVENIISGGNMQMITQAQANGNLQACMAEQQTLQAKVERDKAAANVSWYSDVAASRAQTPSQLDPTATSQLIGGGYLIP